MSGSSTPQQLDGRVIDGWAALERGDIQGARDALQDVYSANPSHPALPLLAAGIRRARPQPVPWGAVALLVMVAGAVAFGVHSWTARRSLPLAATVEPPAASSPAPEAAAPPP